MAKVTKEQVLKVAKLVKLNLSKEEVTFFSENFTDTLAHVEILEKLDTKNVSETYQVTGLTNVFQEPELSETLSEEDSLANAGEKKDGMFATSAVFDRDS